MAQASKENTSCIPGTKLLCFAIHLTFYVFNSQEFVGNGRSTLAVHDNTLLTVSIYAQ